MDRMKRLIEAIRILIEGGFSGYIKINFSQGSLGRVEKFEEIEHAAIVYAKEKNESKRRDKKESSIEVQLQKAVQIILLTVPFLAGCAAPEKVAIVQLGNIAEPPIVRTIQPGDTAYINYTCRLGTGEIVAASDIIADNQLKSNVFVKTMEAGPISVAAVRPDKLSTATREEPLEEEIALQLAGVVTGMKEGERRQAELTAQDIPSRDVQNYIARLPKIRSRPKEMKITVEQYRYKTGKDPEIGQAFSMETAFPGIVAAVTKQDVTIRFSATAGEVIQPPFGPGRIREEGQKYKVDIDARKGGLTRMGGMIGRIADVDDRYITVDYRNPFGGETLICDVTVEKVADLLPSKNGTGE